MFYMDAKSEILKQGLCLRNLTQRALLQVEVPLRKAECDLPAFF